jgi:hypothetical protein
MVFAVFVVGVIITAATTTNTTTAAAAATTTTTNNNSNTGSVLLCLSVWQLLQQQHCIQIDYLPEINLKFDFSYSSSYLIWYMNIEVPASDV